MMAKLRGTSVSVINVGLIVLNLDTRLRASLSRLFDWLAELARRVLRELCESAGALPAARLAA